MLQSLLDMPFYSICLQKLVNTETECLYQNGNLFVAKSQRIKIVQAITWKNYSLTFTNFQEKLCSKMFSQSLSRFERIGLFILQAVQDLFIYYEVVVPLHFESDFDEEESKSRALQSLRSAEISLHREVGWGMVSSTTAIRLHISDRGWQIHKNVSSFGTQISRRSLKFPFLSHLCSFHHTTVL